MSLIFRNFIAIYKHPIAMKNQDEKLAKAQAELERLRNENHNLKRQVKRMKEKDSRRKAERKAALAAEQKSRKEEVMDMSMDDIKKKLVDAGMEIRAAEVIASVMSEDTGTRRK